MTYYTGEHPMNQRRDLDWYLALIPALVLCAVAAAYLWRWHQEPLSSWRGGGFGMYADINDERGRSVRVDVLHGEWQPARMSERLTARITNVRLNPTRANVEAFADYLSCSTVFLSQNPGAKRIQLEYWEQKFDATTYTVRMEKRLEVSREPCPVD